MLRDQSLLEDWDLVEELNNQVAEVMKGGSREYIVNVAVDACGWPHPYLGCPYGWFEAGHWHTGGECDGHVEGVGAFNGPIDSGWMVLCAKP